MADSSIIRRVEDKAQIASDGPTTVAFAGGEACEATLGADGLSGFYGGYDIDGARNFFTSKDKGEQNAANGILAKWTGPVNVAWSGGTASVSIGKKGKAKVAIMLADGTKATANAQLLVGEEWLCVPVVVTKKTNLAFALWLPRDGGEAVVEGLPGDAIVGRAGALKAGVKFSVSKTAALWEQIGVLTDYLPDEVPITLNKTKWMLPKAGKVAYLRGTALIDESKLGENPSGLKLSYKAKDGSFKGSFKAYVEVNGKLKAKTVSVSGVVVGGKGYGSATIKKAGSVAVAIE